MKLSSAVTVALCGVLVASLAAAQRTTGGASGAPSGDKVGIAIALQAGGDSYRFTGQASCTHEPKAYIYTVPSQQWRVHQSEGRRSVSLTFWRPASGSGEMFNLSVSTGDKTHQVDTVKTKTGGSPKGSGEVTFAPAGAGGTFTVNATAANGVKVSGTIKCDAFRAAVVEGGN